MVLFCGNLSFEYGDLQNINFSPISGQSKLIFFVKITKIAKIGPSNDKKSSKNEKLVNPRIQMKVYPKIIPQIHFRPFGPKLREEIDFSCEHFFNMGFPIHFVC